MKRYIVAAGIAAFGFAGLAQAGAPIRINEVRIDDGGSDDSEYFEISGTPGASLDGLFYVVIGDHSADQGAGGIGSRSGQVEKVIDLTGQTIPADGYFLAVTDAWGALSGDVDMVAGAANLFENGDNVTHMIVSGFTGAQGDALDLGTPDGVIDVTPWTSVLDSVSLIEKLVPDFNSDEWNYAGDAGLGSPAGIGPDGTFVPAHIYRTNDGDSAWAIGDFGNVNGAGPADSPGSSNVPTPGALALLGLAGVAGTRRRR